MVVEECITMKWNLRKDNKGINRNKVIRGIKKWYFYTTTTTIEIFQ